MGLNIAHAELDYFLRHFDLDKDLKLSV